MDQCTEPHVEVERIYREQGKRLWWSLFSYAGDREIATDALAEAFTQALGRGAELRIPERWIWKTAFKVAGGMLDERTRHAEVIEGSYEMPEEVTDVLAALAKLPTRQRGAIVLHYYADYPLKEVARILGVSPATVGVHLHRARRKLRELLETSDG